MTWLVLGALLPDLLDKPTDLYAATAGLPAAGHSLLVCLLPLVWSVFHNPGRSWKAKARTPSALIGWAALSHLALDGVALEVLLWPFLGGPAAGGRMLSLTGPLASLSTSPMLLAGEIVGALVLSALAIEKARNGLPDDSSAASDPTAGNREPRLDVSVGVCTRDRVDCVVRILDALREQSMPPNEIVVVDGTQDPVLRDKLAGQRLEYIHLPDDRGLTQARNAALDRMTGDIVLFLDDDTIPEPDLIETLVAAYRQNPEIGGAAGVPLEPEPPGPIRRLGLKLFLRGPFAHPASLLQESPDVEPFEVRRVVGAIQSYRAEVFDKYRFDENLRRYSPGEDKDFSYRVSCEWPILLVPAARARHDVEGWGSHGWEHRFEVKIISYSYHFFKNVPGTIPNWLAYLWLMVGILGEGLAYAALTQSREPLRGVRRGLDHIRDGLDGAAGLVAEDPRSMNDACAPDDGMPSQ